MENTPVLQKQDDVLKSELIKNTNPEDFGLEVTKAVTLLDGLIPALSERRLLIAEYDTVVNLEVSKENIEVFKNLRKKIRDNRKLIEGWHKLEKAFYLNGGRFVDSTKNKEIAVNQNMEEKLELNEKYFENIEKERIAKLVEQRRKILSQYVENPDMYPLAQLDDAAFENLKEGSRLQYEAKIKAEKEAIELKAKEEVLEKVRQARKTELLPYWNFLPVQHQTADFAKYNEEQWSGIIKALKLKKEKHDLEQNELRIAADKAKKLESENLQLKQQVLTKPSISEMINSTEILDKDKINKITEINAITAYISKITLPNLPKGMEENIVLLSFKNDFEKLISTYINQIQEIRNKLK